MIAYVDVAALRETKLVQQLAAMAQPSTVDRDYADFVAATGFDYQRDLDRVLVTARPGVSLRLGDRGICRGLPSPPEDRAVRLAVGKLLLRAGKRPPGVWGKALRNAWEKYRAGLFGFRPLGALPTEATRESAVFSAKSPAILDSDMRARLSRVSSAPVFAEVKKPSSPAVSLRMAEATWRSPAHWNRCAGSAWLRCPKATTCFFPPKVNAIVPKTLRKLPARHWSSCASSCAAH